MRVGSGSAVDASLVKHCPVRQICPLGAVCGTERDENRVPLYPTSLTLSPNEMLWADLNYEQRVYCIQQGAFACIANLDHERETPFALYGAGYAIGLNELYIPRRIASTYYLRPLTVGRVCSFHAKALRRHLEELPGTLREQILCCALTNMMSASYTQLKTITRTPLSDRIAMLLMRVRQLAARDGSQVDEVPLTHGDIASLVAADRVSTTRALRKLEADGLVACGYRSVRFAGLLTARDDLAAEVDTEFHVPLEKPAR